MKDRISFETGQKQPFCHQGFIFGSQAFIDPLLAKPSKEFDHA